MILWDVVNNKHIPYETQYERNFENYVVGCKLKTCIIIKMEDAIKAETSI